MEQKLKRKTFNVYFKSWMSWYFCFLLEWIPRKCDWQEWRIEWMNYELGLKYLNMQWLVVPLMNDNVKAFIKKVS